jgi:hypothetical protein
VEGFTGGLPVAGTCGGGVGHHGEEEAVCWGSIFLSICEEKRDKEGGEDGGAREERRRGG